MKETQQKKAAAASGQITHTLSDPGAQLSAWVWLWCDCPIPNPLDCFPLTFSHFLPFPSAPFCSLKRQHLLKMWKEGREQPGNTQGNFSSLQDVRIYPDNFFFFLGICNFYHQQGMFPWIGMGFPTPEKVNWMQSTGGKESDGCGSPGVHHCATISPHPRQMSQLLSCGSFLSRPNKVSCFTS